MKNQFPEAGTRRGEWLTWAHQITNEAFQIDPDYMERAAVAIFGVPVVAWVASETTDEKVHAICRAALFVRMAATCC